MAYVYMLRCADGSLYTGIASDIRRRLHTHLAGGAGCARYTRAHRPVALAALWQVADLSDAARVEYAVKRLGRARKEALIAAPDRIALFLPERLADITCRADVPFPLESGDPCVAKKPKRSKTDV